MLGCLFSVLTLFLAFGDLDPDHFSLPIRFTSGFYLFLRKILAGVANDFKMFRATTDDTDGTEEGNKKAGTTSPRQRGMQPVS
jgi:hypothetical protein